ncbi:MAG: TIGR02266 family protein [Myxococcota bacterium]|nr:TIGR02266 family protein [Myxococcota bacterium]
MLPPSSQNTEQLRLERERIAREHIQAREQATKHRENLQSQQEKLSALEAQLSTEKAQLNQLKSALEASLAEVQRIEREQNAAQQSTMQLARAMGPLHQKEKGLEAQLAQLDQRLKSAGPLPPTTGAPSTPGAFGALSPGLAAPAAPAPAAPAPAAPAAAPQLVNDEGRAERFEASLEIEVSETSQSNFYTGFTRNISEGGLFIATAKLQDIGSSITFRLKIPPSSEMVELTAIVRWVREHHPLNPDIESGMGVQFVNLTEEIRAQIQRFIENQRESLFFDVD